MNPAGLSAWRSSAHSTSVCATGSPIDRASVVASLGRPWRTSSIACFAAARSGDSAATGALSAGRGLGTGMVSRSRGAALFALPRRCAPFRLRAVRVTLRLGGLARERRHRLLAVGPGGLARLRRRRLVTRRGEHVGSAEHRHGRGEQPDQGAPRDGTRCWTVGDDGDLSVACRGYGCQAGSETCPDGGGRSGCDPHSAACTNAPPSDAVDGMHARPHRTRHNDDGRSRSRRASPWIARLVRIIFDVVVMQQWISDVAVVRTQKSSRFGRMRSHTMPSAAPPPAPRRNGRRPCARGRYRAAAACRCCRWPAPAGSADGSCSRSAG